jgi:hypothetical protein
LCRRAFLQFGNSPFANEVIDTEGGRQARHSPALGGSTPRARPSLWRRDPYPPLLRRAIARPDLARLPLPFPLRSPRSSRRHSGGHRLPFRDATPSRQTLSVPGPTYAALAVKTERLFPLWATFDRFARTASATQRATRLPARRPHRSKGRKSGRSPVADVGFRQLSRLKLFLFCICS